MTAPLVVGWKEYLDLPDLGITGLKAKMDTGARTSALHVASFDVRDDIVHMTVLGHRTERTLNTVAPLGGWLDVRNSAGDTGRRPMIRTRVGMGNHTAVVPLMLADRTGMLFRMLVGRKALEELGAVVDVSSKYLLGRKKIRQL